MQGGFPAVLQQLPETSKQVKPTGIAPDAGAPLKPPLKWAGGKRWLLPYLRPLWDQHRHRRLVEPLCGGIAVSLGLRPTRALANDVNVHVINFYRWLQRGLSITLKLHNNAFIYYAYRKRFNRLIRQGKAESREAAELFYYLNRTGYNGLCRFNRQGELNVPFGKYAKINYTTDFSPYRAVLADWEFTSLDFDRVPLEPDDFVYADPPYDVEFTQYAQDGFGWNDQVRLAEWLARHPGPVVLSNQATPRIIEVYRRLGFHLFALSGPRMISCNGDRTPAKEVLALRNIDL
jgi:DNA adenine methylase